MSNESKGFIADRVRALRAAVKREVDDAATAKRTEIELARRGIQTVDPIVQTTCMEFAKASEWGLVRCSVACEKIQDRKPELWYHFFSGKLGDITPTICVVISANGEDAGNGRVWVCFFDDDWLEDRLSTAGWGAGRRRAVADSFQILVAPHDKEAVDVRDERYRSLWTLPGTDSDHDATVEIEINLRKGLSDRAKRRYATRFSDSLLRIAGPIWKRQSGGRG